MDQQRSSTLESGKEAAQSGKEPELTIWGVSTVARGGGDGGALSREEGASLDRAVGEVKAIFAVVG